MPEAFYDGSFAVIGCDSGILGCPIFEQNLRQSGAQKLKRIFGHQGP
jgi:hypothetical protein